LLTDLSRKGIKSVLFLKKWTPQDVPAAGIGSVVKQGVIKKNFRVKNEGLEYDRQCGLENRLRTVETAGF
jgi:hypothetical protein